MFFVIRTKIWNHLFLIFVLNDRAKTLYIVRAYTVHYKHMVATNSLIINYNYWHHNSNRKSHFGLTKPNKKNKRIFKAG